MDKLLSYIVVRRDLSHAQQVVQASHAAMQMAISRDLLDKKDMGPIHIAALGVKDQRHLMEIVKRISVEGKVDFELFYEPDDDVGYTALCTSPSYQRSNILAKLPLL